MTDTGYLYEYFLENSPGEEKGPEDSEEGKEEN
jgi:hypothetical protein